jgi:putative ABC transport system permease protein
MRQGRLVATTPEYAEVNKLTLVSGRFLNNADGEAKLNVAVLAAGLADKLFPFSDPLGQTVRVDKYFYEIVGVLKDRMPTGGSGGSQAAEDFNSDIYIPLETCKARYGEKVLIRQSGSFNGEQVELHQVTLTVTDMDAVRPTGQVITDLLSRYHVKNDWVVTIPLDRLEEAERASARGTLLLFLIAGISLVVGGIGIMNIMLATVTERTREIGIRRALGAKRGDITLQFLIEAVVQTTVGGLIGAALGVAVVLIAPAAWSGLVWSAKYVWILEWLGVSGTLPARLQIWSILLSLAVSVSVGVCAGFYPAWKASRLDPIEALRHQ